MKKSIFYISFLLVTLMLTLTSCSKKAIEMEEVETTLMKVHSGSVYMQCYEGPYHFNIDSLIKNCSVAKSLEDSVPYSTCNYDFGAHKLADINNFDFKVIRGSNMSDIIFNLELTNTPISQKSAEAKTISEGGKYPFVQFYNGYEIQISENKKLTLFFFYAHVAGCLHDAMAWEYEETE